MNGSNGHDNRDVANHYMDITNPEYAMENDNAINIKIPTGITNPIYSVEDEENTDGTIPMSSSAENGYDEINISPRGTDVVIDDSVKPEKEEDGLVSKDTNGSTVAQDGISDLPENSHENGQE